MFFPCRCPVSHIVHPRVLKHQRSVLSFVRLMLFVLAVISDRRRLGRVVWGITRVVHVILLVKSVSERPERPVADHRDGGHCREEEQLHGQHAQTKS